METLKICATVLLIVGLGIPRRVRNKAPLLFVSAVLSVVLFYIGLGREFLNLIVDGSVKVFSIGFVCFNLMALFFGCWIACMAHELLDAFRS